LHFRTYSHKIHKESGPGPAAVPAVHQEYGRVIELESQIRAWAEEDSEILGTYLPLRVQSLVDGERGQA